MSSWVLSPESGTRGLPVGPVTTVPDPPQNLQNEAPANGTFLAWLRSFLGYGH